MPCREGGLGAPIPPARSRLPVQAASTCPPLPPGDGSPILRVLWADLTPSRPSASRRLHGWASLLRPVRLVFSLVEAPADVCVGVAPSVAHDPSAVRWLPSRLSCAAGAWRASHVPDASFHAYHALRGPRRTLGDLTHAIPLGRLRGRSPHRHPRDARSRGGLTLEGVRAPWRSPGCPVSASAVSCGGPLPPAPRPHAGGVVGETVRRRDFHPARSATLRLAH